VFLVDQQIASPRAEFFKWDACQVRPMVRIQSVPLRLFVHFSSITRTSVLTQRNLHLHCRLFLRSHMFRQESLFNRA
jgi:hypothetical protein